MRDPPTQGHVHAAPLHRRLPSGPVIRQYIRVAHEAWKSPARVCFPHHTIMPSESSKWTIGLQGDQTTQFLCVCVCNRVLLKYKKYRESFWHRQQKGQKEYPKSFNPKGNKPWIFIGRTDAEAETPRLWPPDVQSWLIGKDPNAGKDWGQEEKGATENEMDGWHHQTDMSLSKLWEIVKDRADWHAAVHGVAESWDTTQQLSNNNTVS